MPATDVFIWSLCEPVELHWLKVSEVVPKREGKQSEVNEVAAKRVEERNGATTALNLGGYPLREVPSFSA